MMHRSLLFGAAVAAAMLVLPCTGTSQEKQSSAEMDAMMKKWQEQATPGDAHKKLEDMVGSWKTTTRVWSNGSEAPPVEASGTSEVKWVLGGRFLQQDMSGSLMGMPYSGVGFTGYDNMNKKYTFFWIDNSNTAMFTAEGTFDPAGKVLTTVGKMDEPMTGERGKSAMYVYRMVSKDKHIFEIHDLSLPQGKTRMVEIEYTRVK